VWAFPSEVTSLLNAVRKDAPQMSFSDEHVVDWLPLAEAITRSGATFRMTALGAGWGRWLAAGGALARQIGKDYQLVGVEADEQHFQWMKRHFEENGFEPSRYNLIEAAASVEPGVCQFAVGDPQSWYGQAIIRRPTHGEQTRTVRAMTIEDVLEALSPLDYLHMDIQGAELDFLSRRPDLLVERVRLVNIGTHSIEIEAELRRLFTGLGFVSEYDVSIGSDLLVRVRGRDSHKVHFGDGAQVWRNPKFETGGNQWSIGD
jgi:FkbM family methyltransferase